MGLKETVLGEVEEERLSVSSIVRRVLQRHPLADWKPASIDITARALKRAGLLSPVGEDTDEFEDPVPLEVTGKGYERLRDWQETAPRAPTVREDLLLQIIGSDEDDLPELEAIVRERLVSILRLVETADGQRVAGSGSATPMPWRERRVLVARALDLGVLDGLARGLRRALAEIGEALRRKSR